MSSRLFLIWHSVNSHISPDCGILEAFHFIVEIRIKENRGLINAANSEKRPGNCFNCAQQVFVIYQSKSTSLKHNRHAYPSEYLHAQSKVVIRSDLSF